MKPSPWLRLYPRAWRARYGEELTVLLEARPPNLMDRLDLARGAIDAHLHPELVAPDPRPAGPSADVPAADLRIARRLGIGALVGAGAWIVTWVIAANGPIVYDEVGSYRDGAAAAPILLLAGALLVGGILGQLIVLPIGARAGRVGAIIAIGGVLLWSLAPWMLWAAAAWLAGLVALAASGWRSRIWPAWAGIATVAVAVGMTSLFALAMATGRSRGAEAPELVAALTLATAIWLLVGGTLVRVRRITTGPT